jgi:hypothetical protein
MSADAMRAANWRPIERGALVGWFDLALPSGLLLHDLAAFGDGGIGLPNKPQLNADGTARRDDAGKIRYVPIIEIRDKATRERFEASARAALQRLLGAPL